MNSSSLHTLCEIELLVNLETIHYLKSISANTGTYAGYAKKTFFKDKD